MRIKFNYFAIFANRKISRAFAFESFGGSLVRHTEAGATTSNLCSVRKA